MQNSLGTVFVDTSAWKAYYDEEDEWHGEARGFLDSLASKRVSIRGFLTSDYVLDETITLIRFAHSHTKAVEFAKAVLSSKATRIAYTGDEVFLKALDLFRESKDKEWSFTDCVSFTIMKLQDVTTCFSFDPHFKQAGFQTVPQ